MAGLDCVEDSHLEDSQDEVHSLVVAACGRELLVDSRMAHRAQDIQDVGDDMEQGGQVLLHVE